MYGFGVWVRIKGFWNFRKWIDHFLKNKFNLLLCYLKKWLKNCLKNCRICFRKFEKVVYEIAWRLEIGKPLPQKTLLSFRNFEKEFRFQTPKLFFCAKNYSNDDKFIEFISINKFFEEKRAKLFEFWQPVTMCDPQTNPDCYGSNATQSLEALPEPYQSLLVGLYSVTAVVAFCGNLITLFVLVARKPASRDLQTYLANLAISDILLASLSIPFTYTDFMFGQWLFPAFLCPCVLFIEIVVVFVSVYTLIAIGIGR